MSKQVEIMLGKISVRKFTPKTVKKGKETTKRKKDLQEAIYATKLQYLRITRKM